MASSLPFAFLFFHARSKEHNDLLRFVRNTNLLLKKPGNMLLLSPSIIIKNHFNNAFVLIVPCYYQFPFIIWPLYYVLRIIYTCAFIVRSRRFSVRLMPCSARVASAAFYEARR